MKFDLEWPSGNRSVFEAYERQLPQPGDFVLGMSGQNYVVRHIYWTFSGTNMNKPVVVLEAVDHA